MTYKEWIEYAIVEYDVVSKNYNHKIYENVVKDEKNHAPTLVQLTLRDVLNKCEGTNFEDQIKRAIMKCVYTGARLDVEVRKVMDPFYEV
ncbi:MAG: hypothetical protein LUI02_05555 [Clostridiales bacterium]|nr:hypothetical protein [Clostridiales bacterium]